MKRTTRNAISIIKKAFVITLAILCIVLLTAAIITLSKILFGLFLICLAIYFSFLAIEIIVLPMFRKR